MGKLFFLIFSPQFVSNKAYLYPASAEMLNFDEPRPPKQTGIDAFNYILPTIKSEIVKSRRHWDAHEPKMWSRAQGISDKDLVNFTIEDDLVEVRVPSGTTRSKGRN